MNLILLFFLLQNIHLLRLHKCNCSNINKILSSYRTQVFLSNYLLRYLSAPHFFFKEEEKKKKKI